MIQLTSQINGLESRLKFSRRDKEVTVSNPSTLLNISYVVCFVFAIHVRVCVHTEASLYTVAFMAAGLYI